MARDEGMLVAQATEMGFEDFYRALSYWKQLADPDGADADEEERKAARNVFLEASFDGDVARPDDARPDLGLDLSPASSTASSTPSSRPTAPRPRSAWGGTPRLDELARTSAQRRADALVEMATRSRTAPAEGIRPAPLFTVFVGYETLHGRICELENGTVLAPSALSPGWTRPTSSAPSSRWAAASTSASGPASSPVGHGGPSSCATAGSQYGRYGLARGDALHLPRKSLAALPDALKRFTSLVVLRATVLSVAPFSMMRR